MIRTVNALLATLLATGLAHANTQGAGLLPPPMTEGGITWLSGGIGKTQAQAFEREAKHYPLALVFVLKPAREGARAQFTANVPVRIRGAQDKLILSTTADGPFMLLKLPEGRYKVLAEHNGKTIERHVVVGRAHQRLVFEWAA